MVCIGAQLVDHKRSSSFQRSHLECHGDQQTMKGVGRTLNLGALQLVQSYALIHRPAAGAEDAQNSSARVGGCYCR